MGSMEPGNGHGTGERWPSSGVAAPPRRPPRREAAPKRALATGRFLLDATRKRRAGRIALWTLVVLLAGSGTFLLAWAPITDVIANRRQGKLQQEFQALSPAQWRTNFNAQKPRDGSALTRLRIPKLGVNVIVVEGITGNALRAGVGHYPGNALPGDQTGNVAFAGHRTGFGEPFRHIDQLRAGDHIELNTPLGRFTYEVVPPFDGHSNPWVTGPSDWSVVAATPEPMLTLTSCDPPGTSRYRLIVRAKLVSSRPAG